MNLTLNRNVSVFPKGFDSNVRFEIINERGKKVDFNNWELLLYAESNTLISSDPTLLNKIAPGIFEFKYIKRDFEGFYELFLVIKTQLPEEGDFFYNQLFKPITPIMSREIISLRNQIDKALKSIGKSIDEFYAPEDYSASEAVNRIEEDLPIGYSDAHCLLYLELGLTMINIVPPYTAWTLNDFPFAVAGSLLIDGATIVALESQGLFAVDTDFDYSLGGKSITVRHADGISTFLRDIAERFNTNVRRLKSLYRTKGTIMVQIPFGWGFGRFLSVVPTGWFARFGLGVTRRF